MELTIKDKLDMQYVVKTDTVNNHKEVSESNRTVDLIANTYNYFDSDWDVLVKGCALKSIQERGVNSTLPGKIKHCMHHDLKQIVAKPTLIEESVYKNMDVLHANSFFPEVEDSEKELQKYLADLYDQHSIGFQYMQIEWMEKESEEWDKVLRTLINPEVAESKSGLYLVKEIALYEYSTVAFGANRLTEYIGSKSKNKNVKCSNMFSKLDALHKALRDGVKDKFTVELQAKQIKQMIYELYNQEPSIKDTLIKPSKDDTQKANIELINNHKIF